MSDTAIVISSMISILISTGDNEEMYFIATSEYRLFCRLVNVIASERDPEDDHLAIRAVQNLSKAFEIYSDYTNRDKRLEYPISYWAADQLAVNGLN